MDLVHKPLTIRSLLNLLIRNLLIRRSRTTKDLERTLKYRLFKVAIRVQASEIHRNRLSRKSGFIRLPQLAQWRAETGGSAQFKRLFAIRIVCKCNLDWRFGYYLLGENTHCQN